MFLRCVVLFDFQKSFINEGGLNEKKLVIISVMILYVMSGSRLADNHTLSAGTGL